MSDKKSSVILLNRLQQTLLKIGNTNEEIADVLGCDHSTINKWYNGKLTPSLDKIVSICEKANVSIDYLCGFRQEPTNNAKISDICDYTGLSEEAIKVLAVNQSEQNKSDYTFKDFALFKDILNELICSPEVVNTITELHTKMLIFKNFSYKAIKDFYDLLELKDKNASSADVSMENIRESIEKYIKNKMSQIIANSDSPKNAIEQADCMLFDLSYMFLNLEDKKDLIEVKEHKLLNTIEKIINSVNTKCYSGINNEIEKVQLLITESSNELYQWIVDLIANSYGVDETAFIKWDGETNE